MASNTSHIGRQLEGTGFKSPLFVCYLCVCGGETANNIFLWRGVFWIHSGGQFALVIYLQGNIHKINLTALQHCAPRFWDFVFCNAFIPDMYT